MGNLKVLGCQEFLRMLAQRCVEIGQNSDHTVTGALEYCSDMLREARDAKLVLILLQVLEYCLCFVNSLVETEAALKNVSATLKSMSDRCPDWRRNPPIVVGYFRVLSRVYALRMLLAVSKKDDVSDLKALVEEHKRQDILNLAKWFRDECAGSKERFVIVTLSYLLSEMSQVTQELATTKPKVREKFEGIALKMENGEQKSVTDVLKNTKLGGKLAGLIYISQLFACQPEKYQTLFKKFIEDKNLTKTFQLRLCRAHALSVVLQLCQQNGKFKVNSITKFNSCVFS